MNHDYSHYETQILPTSRALYEHLIRNEWSDAEKEAMELITLIYEIRRYAIFHMEEDKRRWR